jgi:hypothetical protein
MISSKAWHGAWESPAPLYAAHAARPRSATPGCANTRFFRYVRNPRRYGPSPEAVKVGSTGNERGAVDGLVLSRDEAGFQDNANVVKIFLKIQFGVVA